MTSSNTAEFTAKLKIDTLSLVSAESRRESFEEFKSGGAEVSFSVDVDEKNPLNSKTKVNLRLFDGETEADLYVGSSEYRLMLTSEDELSSDPETIRQIAALALRLTFPFHRSRIADGVNEVGLPSYFLPLVSDEKWLGIVDAADVDYDPSDDQVPAE